jgi:cell division protein FtsL
MGMQINTRTYRPAQMAYRSERSKLSGLQVTLSSGQKKILAVFVGVFVMTMLVVAGLIAGRIDTIEARVQQMQATNIALVNEHVRLLASRAQLSSKDHITALAERKLHLFEPVKGQVHRM